MKKVSIYAIILNYNSSLETIELFQDLKSFQFPYLTLLVVDNNSRKKDLDELKSAIPYKNIIINNKNLGYAGGNNIGIEIALKNNADYVWILNPDIRIEQLTFPLLLKTISEDSTLAAVGPRIIQREHPEKIFSDGEVIDTRYSFHTFHKNFNKIKETVPEMLDYDIDYIDGSCILMSCKAINQLGKISDSYFLYFEETDWCTIAKNKGWKLAVNRKAVVYNLMSKKSEVYHYYYTRNKLLFSKKFNLNYQTLKKQETTTLVNEIKNRFRGKYLQPYFFSRLKGLIAGILQK